MKLLSEYVLKPLLFYTLFFPGFPTYLNVQPGNISENCERLNVKYPRNFRI